MGFSGPLFEDFWNIFVRHRISNSVADYNLAWRVLLLLGRLTIMYIEVTSQSHCTFNTVISYAMVKIHLDYNLAKRTCTVDMVQSSLLSFDDFWRSSLFWAEEAQLFPCLAEC